MRSAVSARRGRELRRFSEPRSAAPKLRAELRGDLIARHSVYRQLQRRQSSGLIVTGRRGAAEVGIAAGGVSPRPASQGATDGDGAGAGWARAAG